MYRDPHDFNIGDLVINKSAQVLFSTNLDLFYYGLFFVDISKGEILVVIEKTPMHITVRTESGEMGWQAGYHFELLQKASK
jgi:hypothetical protein